MNTTELRIKRNKELLIKQLKKVPVISLACNQIGISRASFYRWQAEDGDFKKAVEEALAEGEAFINDLSESQVISLIKEKNWPAIRFWLTNHHPKYANKLEITTNNKQEELNPEQESVVRKALQLAFPALPDNQNDTANNESKDKQPNNESKSDAKPDAEPTKPTAPAS